ncbi:MAG: polyprenyl synthetase family protein [Chloroflexota bacterium]
MSTTEGLLSDGTAGDLGNFASVLSARRSLVYDYLDNWRGAEAFKPQDIHDALFSYVRHRGKGLRPLLLMLCCGVAGGDELQALPAAAAVEIFHIWTLVHDDIIDRDDMRRGSPTVHARYKEHARNDHGLGASEAAHYGVAVAILAGDLQQSWAYALLGELSERGVDTNTVLALIRRMSESLTPQLLEGEMLDVQFALKPLDSITEDDVLHMLQQKTAALLEYAAWAGATIGLGGRQDDAGLAERLGRFASLCGVAFQLQDDLLGLTADEALLGKPVGSDIREGKRTLTVYRALARLGESDREQLLATLGNDKATPTEITAALGLIQQSGAHDDIRVLADSYISQALAILDQLPQNKSVDLLRSWATFMLSRSY